MKKEDEPMTMPDDAKKQKEKADQLVARVKGDPDFKRQAMDDPLGVLRQAGLSDEAIGDLLREDGRLEVGRVGKECRANEQAEL